MLAHRLWMNVFRGQACPPYKADDRIHVLGHQKAKKKGRRTSRCRRRQIAAPDPRDVGESNDSK